MTDAGFLSLTPQLAAAHWGWTIAFFLWFIGLSGMLMALFYFVRDKRIALVSFIASILGEPSCVAAHNFYNRYGFLFIHICIYGNLADCRSYISGCTSKSRSMVCVDQIIVDCFWFSEDTDITACLRSITGKFARTQYGKIARINLV